MRPYRYPKKLRPDVDFTTLRRNLSYITTQIFLRRHVISRTSGEITRILYEMIIALYNGAINPCNPRNPCLIYTLGMILMTHPLLFL